MINFLNFDIFLTIFSLILMIMWEANSWLNMVFKVAFFGIMLASLFRVLNALGIVLSSGMRLV